MTPIPRKDISYFYPIPTIYNLFDEVEQVESIEKLDPDEVEQYFNNCDEFQYWRYYGDNLVIGNPDDFIPKRKYITKNKEKSIEE